MLFFLKKGNPHDSLGVFFRKKHEQKIVIQMYNTHIYIYVIQMYNNHVVI